MYLLEKLSIDIVKNRYIGTKHLGSKELHLSLYGTARLVLVNFNATIRKLWSKFGNLGNPAYQSNVTSVSSDHSNFQKLNHCNKNQTETSTFSFQETNDKSWENSKRSNATETLRNLSLENPTGIVIEQLNINSIRKKFEMLTSVITNKIDVLLLSETKIDEKFPYNSFLFQVLQNH